MLPLYEDFFLIVDGDPRRYTVEAHGPLEVRVPPTACSYHATPELTAALERLKIGAALSRQELEAVGSMLFDSLFPRPISRAFERAGAGLPRGTTLRIKLVIRAPELSHLPWELAYDADNAVFLAGRLSSPLVRFVESSTPVAPLLADGPPRLLYVQANPRDSEPLDLGASERSLRAALGSMVEITAVRNATPERLRDMLREPPGFHILHYDGHAAFDPAAAAGHIALHDDEGNTFPLGGELLAAYLDGTAIRLVVLAACETGVDSRRKRFTGVAQQLMRAGSLPAVIANQFAIADDAAIAFNGGFYGALVDRYPVDAAVTEGRKAIWDLFGGSADAALAAPDWATPVLFMRAVDGAIFPPLPSSAELAAGAAPGPSAGPPAAATGEKPAPTFNFHAPVEAGVANYGGVMTFEQAVEVDLGAPEFTDAGSPGAGSWLGVVVAGIDALTEADPATKAGLRQLAWRVAEILDVAPAAQSVGAGKIAARIAALVAEARKDVADQELLEFNAESLKRAAASVADDLPAVLPLARQFAAGIAGLGRGAH